MPVTFKSDKREPFIIDRDGTRFYFYLSPGRKRQVRMNMYAIGTFEAGRVLTDEFRVALYKWENLIDENGEQIPFSEAVRDALVNETDVFTDDDVFRVIGIGEPVQKKTELKNGLRTHVSGTGIPTDAGNVMIVTGVDFPAESAR